MLAADRILAVKCPTLRDLPPPPPGKTGWPWTEETEHESAGTGFLQEPPKISIVTPSYNQGQFIEATIRSVLLQGYPDIEYMIIDGGSSDQSAAIIEKYSPWLSYWVSERDRGQSHAINKGLSRATGDVVAYINSDDVYLRNAFKKVALGLQSGLPCNWIVGACYVMYDHDHPQRCDMPRFTDDLEAWYGRRCGLPQPSTFLRRELLTRNGLFEESLSYGFDHEYWIRLILSGNRPRLLNSALASFTLHGGAKTASGGAHFRQDAYRIEEMHEPRLAPPTRIRLKRSRPVRRWESEVREGLQLCAAWRWREGCNILLRRMFDRRLPVALLTRPDIVFRLFTTAVSRFPRQVADIIRYAVRGVPPSRPVDPSEFWDPLGEYDLWSHACSSSPQVPAGEVGSKDDAGSS